MTIMDIILNLQRYSTEVLAYKLDAKFAAAVDAAANLLEAQGERIADLENEKSNNGWIPVTERLPELHTVKSDEPLDPWEYESSGYVLAHTESGVKVLECNVDHNRTYWVEECGTTYRSVAHWMPLPAPPKEGEMKCGTI